MLAGLTGIFRKKAITRSLSARVAGFLYATVISVGTFFGSAWNNGGNAEGTDLISGNSASFLLPTLSQPRISLLDR